MPEPRGIPRSWDGRPLAVVSSCCVAIGGEAGLLAVAALAGGAGGNVGIGTAAKSPTDGYTIVLATPGVAITPSLYSKLGYDPSRDLAPVARVSAIPNIMVVHPSVPAKTLREFIALEP